MSTLLAEAAPAPVRPLDVSSIVRRGNGIRLRRMVASIAAVPVVVGALWAGAQAGLGRQIPDVPAAPPPCEWESEMLTVFLDADTPPKETAALARQVIALDHVESVEWNDLFEKRSTISQHTPHLWERLSRRSFPPWLYVRLEDPSHAAGVAADLEVFELVDEVAGAERRSNDCYMDELKRENDELERQLRDLRRKLVEKMAKQAGRRGP